MISFPVTVRSKSLLKLLRYPVWYIIALFFLVVFSFFVVWHIIWHNSFLITLLVHIVHLNQRLKQVMNWKEWNGEFWDLFDFNWKKYFSSANELRTFFYCRVLKRGKIVQVISLRFWEILNWLHWCWAWKICKRNDIFIFLALLKWGILICFCLWSFVHHPWTFLLPLFFIIFFYGTLYKVSSCA